MSLKEKAYTEGRVRMDNFIKYRTPLKRNSDLCKVFFNLRDYCWHKQLTPDPYRTAIPRRLYYMVDHGWLHLESLYLNILPWVSLLESNLSTTRQLNEAEWFVLLSSAYLHDCGMSLPDYMEDDFLGSIDSIDRSFNKNVYLISKPSLDIALKAKAKGRITDKQYRKLHADFGAWWIALCKDNRLIPNSELQEMARLVAKVVSLHGRDGAENRKNYLSEKASYLGREYVVRVGLMAAIIAVADGCLVGREWVDDLSDTDDRKKSRDKRIRDLKKEYDKLTSITHMEDIEEVRRLIEKDDTDPKHNIISKLCSYFFRILNKKANNTFSAGKIGSDKVTLENLENQIEVWDNIDLFEGQSEHYLRHIVIQKIALLKNKIVIVPCYRNDDENYSEFSKTKISIGDYSAEPGILIERVKEDIIDEIQDINKLLVRICENEPEAFSTESFLFPSEVEIIKNKQEADIAMEAISERDLSYFDDKLLETAKTRSAPMQIEYQFVRYGTAAPLDLVHSNVIYLDVGQDCRVGVLDHHQYKVFQASATQLVVNYPEYVRQAINPYGDGRLTFIIHRNPDLDAVASVALALDLIEREADEAAQRVAKYVDLVDSGRQGYSHGNPFSLYSAYAQVLQNLSEKMGPEPEDKDGKEQYYNKLWKAAMENGVRLVEYVLKESREKDLQVDAINAFKCDVCLSERDRSHIESDKGRYNKKMADKSSKMQTLPLQIPMVIGGTRQVNGLFIRNVQSLKDPERVMFFKDWARADYERNPTEGGFSFICVIEEDVINGNARCWISVRPNEGIELRGLGETLELREVEKRIQKNGEDRRWYYHSDENRREVRKGFNNPDPWYDGRGHDYTIIETPNDGTVLTADEIESLVINAYSTVFQNVDADINIDAIVNLTDEDLTNGISNDLVLASKVQKLDYIFDIVKNKSIEREVFLNDIFISYPQKYREWINENINILIKDKFNQIKIYFEEESIQPGLDWLSTVGNAINSSRVFIPLFCPDYSNSPLCQWEYETAQRSYMQNKKPLFLPILFDRIGLPESLIRQSLVNTNKSGWQNDLIHYLSVYLD